LHIDGQAVGPRGHAVFTAFADALGLPGLDGDRIGTGGALRIPGFHSENPLKYLKSILLQSQLEG